MKRFRFQIESTDIDHIPEILAEGAKFVTPTTAIGGEFSIRDDSSEVIATGSWSNRDDG